MEIWYVVAISALTGAALAAVLALVGFRRGLWVMAGLGLLLMAGLVLAGRAAGGWEGIGYIAAAVAMVLPAAGGIGVVALAAWWHDRRRVRRAGRRKDDDA